MIRASFTESGKILSLRVEGHAGYAEHGKDIVCASASILAYTLAQIVKDAEHLGYLASPPVTQMESGNTVISCEAKDYDDFVIAKSMFTFAIKGYSLLEHTYPQYVRLIES